jgi:dipeptidyl aminopeptidase/acylaminoacyl peptidase
LTLQNGGDYFPNFSPEGTHIVFEANRDVGGSEIYIMEVNGENQTNLTNDSAIDQFPQFSPNGEQIIFISNRDGNFEIYIMDENGGNQTNLTNDPGDDMMHQISPNGDQIVFVSSRDGNDEIYIMDMNGENQMNLTINDGSDLDPAFSSDGSTIIFISNREENYGIYTMEPDGSNLTYLSTNSDGDYSPNYSLDRTKILYQSYIDDNYELFMMNADGTNQVNLTNDLGNDKEPRFQPYVAIDSIEFEYMDDWNLVSVPLVIEDQGYEVLFSESIEGTLFSFDSTYAQQEELELGRGYWLRFNASGNILITGVVVNEWIIEVNHGWNLIGSITYPIEIEDLLEENELIIPGTVFEFNGSYINAESVLPGKSYWLRTFEEGFIILSSQNQ